MRVEAAGLSKRYGRTTGLAPVSFEVDGPTSLAVTGPSGAGKSTLLRLVAGLERPTRGRVRIDGRRPGAARAVGLVPQRADLDLAQLALEAAAAARGPHVRDRAGSLLARLGVRPTAQVGELSLGDQRRVLVARTLVTGPRLLLADEPTANLDAEGGAELVDLLLGTVETGTLVLLATHDAAVAARCEQRLEL